MSEDLTERVKKLEDNVSNLFIKFESLEKTLNNINTKADKILDKFSEFLDKVGGLTRSERKITALQSVYTNLEDRFATLSDNFRKLYNKVLAREVEEKEQRVREGLSESTKVAE